MSHAGGGGRREEELRRRRQLRLCQAAKPSAGRDFSSERSSERVRKRKGLRGIIVFSYRCLFFLFFLPFNPSILDGITKQG